MKIKNLICGALVATSLMCGIGCANQEPIKEIIEREIIREVVVEVEKPVEIIIEKEVIVEVPKIETIEKEVIKTNYTLIVPEDCTILTLQDAEALEIGGILDKVLIAPGDNRLELGYRFAYLGQTAPVLGVYGMTQMNTSHSVEFSYFYDFTKKVRFVKSNGEAWMMNEWLASGTITDIKKVYNDFGHVEEITIYIDVKGE